MKILRLIRNNLIYYRKKNLLLALGVAISGAVLTGALMVGDSVEYSLNRIVEYRLGNVTHVLKAGDRYFTGELSGKISRQLNVPVSSLLLQEGSGVAAGGQQRINNLQVIGVDHDFDRMAGLDGTYGSLSGDSVIISANLASRLNLGIGDEILLRINRASLIPLNAPFVSDAEEVVPFRAVVVDIAGEAMLGRFNLKVSQAAPFNVFLSLQRMQELMDFSGRINVLLLEVKDGEGEDEIREVIRESFSARDAGLNMEYLDGLQQLSVTSDRVFIDNVLSDQLDHITPEGIPLITYFVNHLDFSGRSTPYSFVSTLPDQWLKAGEIIINEWLAEDLSAGVGDTIRLTYFVVGPLRELTEITSGFVVRSVVPIEGRFADRKLMPDLPGLSDAGNCRDWDTGVPITLEEIRDKDEDYWDRYAGIPKAYIQVSQAVEMWKNRFGTYTAFRFDMGSGDAALRVPSILDGFDPQSLGFTLESVRTKGFDAAGSGVDFSQLFGGLSFFLLLAGVLLTVLLFLLNLESRESQLRTLVVMGIPLKIIRRVMAAESLVVALVGGLAGVALSLLYNHLVFRALNGVWRDVVRTEMMHMDVRASTLATGLVLTLIISVLALYIPLSRMLKRHFISHRASGKSTGGPVRKFITGQLFIALGALLPGIAAAGLIISQLSGGQVVNVPVFFAAGGLLLISAVLFYLWYLGRLQQEQERGFDLRGLSWKNALRNRTRSITIVILFAIGAFLVVSTGSNRKDLFRNSEDPASGTGGFLYYAESTVPVLKQLNDPAVQYEFGLEGNTSFVQFRVASGDDASCLNLNKVVNPQILGVDPGRLDGSFSFLTRTPFLDEAHPWSSLDQVLPGGLIPAIADETVIKWGLGLEVGDTLLYTNAGGGTMKLLLIGGLAPSVFQGNVIISGSRFLEQFPQSSGTNIFLVRGETADTAAISTELYRGMRDLGWEMQLTATRLSEFNSVTNTYLSIFMVMGALGLLVGTFGLVVVLSRSILERKQEMALLKAVGFGRERIRKLVVREYMILLLTGIGTGFLAAIVATLPSILSAHTGTSFTAIVAWLVILLANGWAWIHLITRASLKDASIYDALRNE